MITENLLDVLIYLYENYMDNEDAIPTDQIVLEEELLQAGFAKGEVHKAFDWLDELVWRQDSLTEHIEAERKHPSIRIYTDQEQQKIDIDTQGLLLHLEQIGILDPISRELVIERCMAIETPVLSEDDVQWIVLLVLLNQPGQENAFAMMEGIIYDEDLVYIH